MSACPVSTSLIGAANQGGRTLGAPEYGPQANRVAPPPGRRPTITRLTLSSGQPTVESRWAATPTSCPDQPLKRKRVRVFIEGFYARVLGATLTTSTPTLTSRERT